MKPRSHDMPRRRTILALVCAPLLATGCSKPAELVVGALPIANPAAASSEGNATATYEQSPTEIYVRIARGANACWFGRDGPLKATHILFANAEPPDKGGNAEIVIFERDPNAAPENQRALRALKVAIARTDQRTQVTVQPLKLTVALAAQLPADVQRWAGGDPSCTTTSGKPEPAVGDATATTPVKPK
jgi:hypothetical protein